LGRRGLFIFDLETNKDFFKARHEEAISILSTFKFNEGSKYSDFNPKVDAVADCSLEKWLSGCKSRVKLGGVKKNWLQSLASVLWSFRVIIFFMTLSYLYQLFGRKSGQN
jgi:uncharacterized membrane-anchored protein